MKIIQNFFIFFSVLIFYTLNLSASDPLLLIKMGKQEKKWNSSELLQHPKLETIELPSTPAYDFKIKFKAIRATELFKDFHIEDDSVIQFKALDGFAAPISKERFLSSHKNQSIAYIAIEDPKNKWPVIPKFKSSAGPFYLVWQNPELSHIDHGEWPLLLSSFEIKGTLQSLYPLIFPSTFSESQHPATLGFKLFTKNCFSCHTINKQGASQFGPDLNLPMNPTEYMTEAALKKLIRDPQSVRHWPHSRMIAFPENQLSQIDLENIIQYLKEMSKNKK